jgi:glycerol uptake facilitator-like aquaporin
VENNHKNVIAAGIFIIVFIMAFLVSEDILKSLVLGILIAIIIEIIIGNYKDTKENPQLRATVETKTKSESDENSQKIIKWKAVLIGLIVSGILVAVLLTTPPSDGATELSEDASILLTLLVMGAVFLGGVVTGYMSHSTESGLINS